MSVDCNVSLPPSVDYEDVATAIGALLGLTPTKEFIPQHRGDDDGFFTARAHPGVKVSTHTPRMLSFDFEPGADKEAHYCYFFFAGPPDGRHTVTMRSRPVWVAVAKKLVEVFGGRADYNDADATDVDYEQPTALIMTTDDSGYEERKRRLYELKPLTKADISEARKSAAYDG